MSTVSKFLSADSLAPDWTFPGSYGALSSPVVVAGDRLIGVASSSVFAVDLYTGRPAPTGIAARPNWIYTLQSFYGGDPQVVAADGAVYLMDGDELIALNLSDAQRLLGWNVPKLPQVTTLFSEGGRVVAVNIDPSSGSAMVSGFIAATGARAFGPVKATTESPGRVAYGNGAVFFVASNALNAVNVDFGDSRWKFSPAGDALTPTFAPLVADKTVLVSGTKLYAVDVETGTQRFSIVSDSTTSASGGELTWFTPAADIPPAPVAASRAANFQMSTLLHDTQGGAPLTGMALTAAVIGRSYGGCAVATNTAGEVLCFALSDGTRLWRATVNSPGAPSIIEDTVYVTTDDRTSLARFNLRTGQPIGAYSLPDMSTSQEVAIANGALFITNESGKIVAWPFATQSAAFFDGATSMIAVKPEGTQFDFGTDDFTIEAWFRSSTGGEIVSTYPTSDAKAHGIRINLTPAGQIRVAVTNATRSSYSARRTNRTGAADGEWHHVAVVRRSGAFMIAVDGLSHDVRAAESASDAALPIGGASALTIGAYIAAKDAAPESFFRGLIREVRIWDRALDLPTIANNKNVQLKGSEPRLKGLWRLAEVQSKKTPVEPVNEVRKHRVKAKFVNAASKPTDLEMDRSAYPYLLHESKTQWPYAGTWAARGADQAIGSASCSVNGVAAYATDNAIYAVGVHDGKRVWAMDVSQPASDPVADGGDFLVLTTSESLLRIDAKRGGKLQLSAFPRYSSDERPISPAVSGQFIAAAMGGGTICIWDRLAPTAKSMTVSGTPERLAFGSAGLIVATRSGAKVTLTLIDPRTATVRGTVAVTSDAFCMAGESIFAVVNKTVVRLDAAKIGAPALATSATLGGAITGLAAIAADATVVATTDAGIVYGLTLGGLTRWSTTLPIGRGGGANAVNPPVDDGNRVMCTTSSGTIALLDGESGALVGLYSTPHGAVGTPAMVAGTVFTGCVDIVAAANDDLAEIDGALHSIVFGETMALRLNLDENGALIAAGKQHAVVDLPNDDATLRLLHAHESCVEAWVNVPAATNAGGGIVGLAPTPASKFDVNLWLAADGTVHYTSRALDDTTWTGVHAQAATSIVDGKWHHIAVSRSLAPAPAEPNAPDRVIIYVDGQAVPTTSAAAPVTPKKTAVGLKAYLGATTDDDLAAAQPFRGMIAEVRLWDTYLVSSEISSRMHVKLRGDEPGLIAFWNFDLGRIGDASREGHDGELALEAVKPVWWVTDLPFSMPSYPFITNTAAITSQDEGQPTAYSLTIKVCSADGKGLGNQKVHAWYVKRSSDDPASVFVNSTELQAVDSHDEPHPKVLRLQKAYSGTTASDGTLKLSVVSTLAGHGPALDVWTSFMPLNERFHVDVLIDNQTLAKPTPPSLTAQAKLIQDYHYTTGNKVDESRDRSTWRVVLRATNPGDLPRGNEPITLWASQSVTVEVLATQYIISQDNAITLNAEETGEMTVVLSAAGLTAPTLYARAGFMHRNDRVVIDPHQDVHGQLTKLEPDQLTKPRMTNWKPGAKEDEGSSLLKTEQKGHAPDIAKAIRQVTAAAAPADPNAPPRAGRLLRAPRAPFTAMRQPAAEPASDTVIVRRAFVGASRPAPVDPDAFRAALGGNLGFMIETGAGGFKYTALATQAQVLMARGTPTPLLARPDHLLGSFWDDIVDVVVDVYEAARTIVVTVADAVEVAITTLVNETINIVNIVVKSVEQAIDAVVGFFKALAVELEKIIEFLRVIFNWKAIIDTHDILHKVFLAAADMAMESTKDMSGFTNAVASLVGRPSVDVPTDGPSLNAASSGQGGENDPVVASSKSVEGKSMMQKTTSTPSRSTAGSEAPKPVMPQPSPIDAILQELPSLANSLFDLSPGDLVARLRDLLARVAEATLIGACQGIVEAMKGFAAPIKWVIDLLDAPINIPFISDLYRWITNSELTLLDVLCLALAIPVNIAYAAITLIRDGRARKFADDAAALPDEMKRMKSFALGAGETNGAANAVVPKTNIAPEVVFVIFRAITAVTDSALDAAAVSQARAPSGTGFLSAKRTAIFKIISGVAGMVTLTVQITLCNKMFETRVRAVAGDDAHKFLPPWLWLTWTIYGVLMALRLKNVVVGGWALKSTGPAGSYRLIDITERVVSNLVSVAAIPILVIQVMQLIELKPVLAGFKNDNVTKEYELFAIRDMMGIVGMMFEVMYAKLFLIDEPKGDPPPSMDLLGQATTFRFYSSAAATVLHAVAVFGYGD